MPNALTLSTYRCRPASANPKTIIFRLQYIWTCPLQHGCHWCSRILWR